MIVFLPIALPIKLIIYIHKHDSKYESSAEKFLRESEEYSAERLDAYEAMIEIPMCFATNVLWYANSQIPSIRIIWLM